MASALVTLLLALIIGVVLGVIVALIVLGIWWLQEKIMLKKVKRGYENDNKEKGNKGNDGGQSGISTGNRGTGFNREDGRIEQDEKGEQTAQDRLSKQDGEGNDEGYRELPMGTSEDTNRDKRRFKLYRPSSS